MRDFFFRLVNNNLEQQAMALFESTFIRFDNNDEPLVLSPIGTMIPQSYRMIQIQDIPHILETGKRPKGGAVSEGIPSVGAENVKKLGDFDSSSAKFIPLDFADKMKKGKINGYELLIYKDGGKPGTFIPHFSMFGEGFPEDFFLQTLESRRSCKEKADLLIEYANRCGGADNITAVVITAHPPPCRTMGCWISCWWINCRACAFFNCCRNTKRARTWGKRECTSIAETPSV